MALKPTIHKAAVQFSNLDANVYSDHQLTLARHPSETDARMMVRLLAYALNAPGGNDEGALEFAKDMFDPDEPCLWQKDYSGLILHWIELGQPDPRRMLQAAGKARRVSVYSFSNAGGPWWSAAAEQVGKAKALAVWSIPQAQAEQLATLADKSMSLQITLQDGVIYVEAAGRTVEVTMQKLNE